MKARIVVLELDGMEDGYLVTLLRAALGVGEEAGDGGTLPAGDGPGAEGGGDGRVLVEPGDDEEGRTCEGCGKPATTQDVEGVPLCDGCVAELKAEGTKGTEPLTPARVSVTPPRRAGERGEEAGPKRPGAGLEVSSDTRPAPSPLRPSAPGRKPDNMPAMGPAPGAAVDGSAGLAALLAQLDVGERKRILDMGADTAARSSIRYAAQTDPRFEYQSQGQGQPAWVKRVKA